jgi:hypothetical protein
MSQLSIMQLIDMMTQGRMRLITFALCIGREEGRVHTLIKNHGLLLLRDTTTTYSSLVLCRGVPKMLMERPVPLQPPQETDDKTEMGMLTWHVRSQWFCTHGQYEEAYKSRLESIKVLLPESSKNSAGELQGLIGPQKKHMLPLLRCFLISLRDICEKIDQEVKVFDDHSGNPPPTYVEEFVRTVTNLYAAIKNDDERSFACIKLYIIGWQCAYKLNRTTVVSKWQLPGMFGCSCMLHVLV